ncbi:spore gernimation protein [Cytobacillus depressus]|uniref:Spore gernimation protein n=1 Tax=Cytobacillus depressus TaxID=1602942 RepID=A0A6L3V980_9BACI|nr:spore germination protein GerPC [Cytobacillus depressus]KAB2337169.1 spore gernimation protein [Cytobacillus depressus]
MNQELYSYLQKMHLFIEAQEKRISYLEKKVKELEKLTGELKTRPPIRVDRIEYKFDQLKVETLDGTLNIGLNPSELQEIEDFAINNKGINTPNQPKVHFQRTMELEEEMYKYLETDLQGVIEETAQALNTTVDESYTTFIKEDIKKQLPIRIEYYLKQQAAAPKREQSPENEESDLNQPIVEQLKKEIRNGVQTFLKNLPENMKGMKNE